MLVDPLDSSELAVRGLAGYTQLMIYSRCRRRPIVAVVGHIYHHLRLYVAARDDHCKDHAWLITADGDRHPLDLAAHERIQRIASVWRRPRCTPRRPVTI